MPRAVNPPDALLGNQGKEGNMGHVPEFLTSGCSPPRPDLHVENHGSIFLLSTATPAGRAWVEEHLPADAMTFGGAIVVEHRYIVDIVAGAFADGLEVR